MKLQPILQICLLFFTSLLSAQTAKYPFPQNVTYPYGVISKKISNEFVQTWYDKWKTKYLQQCNGNIRPGVSPLDKSLVEAQGFAMVAVAYMGDKDIFDKLYSFYKTKVNSTACGLMNWKVNCSGFESNGMGAATDGDVDVACALIVADWQWPGSGYDKKAKDLIKILEGMVTECSGISTLYPGCNGGNKWGGCQETDISYYTPAFFRYYAKYSDKPEFWIKLADDTQKIRDNAANKNTGLVPDWQSASGTAGAGSRKGYYSFDAQRAPYKQTMDYLWHGTKAAGEWAKKLSSWAYKTGVSSLKDEYNLDGSARGSNHNMAAIGSFAVSAMANTQEVADKFAEEVLKLRDEYWYSGYLGNLYLLALTGNMWNPDIIKSENATTSSKNKPSGSFSKIPDIVNAKDRIVISGLSDIQSVTVMSISGKVVKKIQTSVIDGKSVITVPDLSKGCYFLQMKKHSHSQPTVKMISVF